MSEPLVSARIATARPSTVLRAVPALAVDRDEFLDAMSAAVTGVTVVTTDGAAGRLGLTVGTMVSISRGAAASPREHPASLAAARSAPRQRRLRRQRPERPVRRASQTRSRGAPALSCPTTSQWRAGTPAPPAFRSSGTQPRASSARWHGASRREPTHSCSAPSPSPTTPARRPWRTRRGGTPSPASWPPRPIGASRRGSTPSRTAWRAHRRSRTCRRARRHARAPAAVPRRGALRTRSES